MLEECAICLCDIEVAPRKRKWLALLRRRLKKKQPVTTSCNHTFHKQCLENWSKNEYNSSNNLCPICRSELFEKYNYKYVLAVVNIENNAPTGNIIRLPVEMPNKMTKLEFNLILAEQQKVVIKILSCDKIRV